MSDEIEIDLPDELQNVNLDEQSDEIDLSAIETDDTNSEDTEVEMSGEKEPEKQEKMVPLSALEAERKKWKDKLEREKTLKNLNQTKHSNDSFDEQTFLSKEIQRFTKLGYDEDSARMFAEDKLESKKEIEALKSLITNNSKDLSSQKRNIELEQLKTDEFYADIEDVREEVEALAEKTGLSIKQAYNALYADTKLKGSKADQQRVMEQKILRDLKRKESASVDMTPTGGSTVATTKVKLTNEQIQIAKLAGMTPAEYYRLTKTDTLDKYRKTKNR